MTLRNLPDQQQKSRRTKLSKPTRLSPEEAESNRVYRKAKRLYQTKLKALLEPTHTGRIAVIEPDSGEYFLGSRIDETLEAAIVEHPDKLFYIVRVGYPAALKIRKTLSL